ncbi:hypothetical protein V6N11_082028 [Hibiscus sabdariffa]|uniref:Polygalacturonase n=1 Tax=Hibiscus sabdariffa TaxID=183260 RepID=A0ABR2QGQ4_9ROSI
MIQDITTRDSKQFHVNLLGCKNITLEKFSVRAPQDSPNTDGIHIGRSDGVNVIDSDIRTGDDCISIGDGTKHLDIKGVTCGPGHGISIGSLGKFENEEPVEGITASKCNLTDTTNGVRIKTWAGEYAGTASDIHFEDITVKNVSCPIIVDQKYCPSNKCKMNEESNVKLSKISFKNIRGTAALPEVVKIICSGKFPCENVELADIDITYSGPNGPGVSECKNVKPKITGCGSFWFIRMGEREDALYVIEWRDGFWLYGAMISVSFAQREVWNSFRWRLRDISGARIERVQN